MIKRKNIYIPQIITYLISFAIYIIGIVFSPFYGHPHNDGIQINLPVIIAILFIYMISLFIVQVYFKQSKNNTLLENILFLILSSLGLVLILRGIINQFNIQLLPIFSILILIFQFGFFVIQRYTIKKISEISEISNPIIISFISIPILLIFFSAILFVYNGAHSWSDYSRMATIQSVVEDNSLIINYSDFGLTGDKVFVNGNFYSDKLITSVVPGIIVYWVLFKAGIFLSFGSNLAYQLITLFTIKLFWLAGLAAFYKILQRVNIKELHRWVLVFILGFASTYFSYSTVYNNHLLTASYLIIAFYFYMKAIEQIKTSQYLFMSGLFFSLAGSGNMPSAIFYVSFFILILINKEIRSKLVFFLIPTIFTVLPTLIINFQISGSILPVTMNIEYFDYPGSMWADRMDSLSGMASNGFGFFLIYSLRLLFGLKGFITYHPYLLIAIPLMITEIIKSRQFKKEAIAISAASFIMMLYYFLFTNNFGGDSFGIRWFVALLPFFIFFLYSYFQKPNKKLNLFLFASVSFAFAVAIIGSAYVWGNILIP